MVAVYSSALSGVASNPALPTWLLLRLLAHDENGVTARPVLPSTGPGSPSRPSR